MSVEGQDLILYIPICIYIHTHPNTHIFTKLSLGKERGLAVLPIRTLTDGLDVKEHRDQLKEGSTFSVLFTSGIGFSLKQ